MISLDVLFFKTLYLGHVTLDSERYFEEINNVVSDFAI